MLRYQGQVLAWVRPKSVALACQAVLVLRVLAESLRLTGGGFADTAFAGCNGNDVFDAFDGGDAGLYFVRCDFRVDAEVDMRIARDADDGFLQAVGDVGGDMPDGESEFQSDMELSLIHI